ncbi:MAG TPA: hypothetical protein VGO35_06895 [Gammaproteobacteria bacterium]|jgi:hypothetical protein|nr:hypothetical protein [Gammaproteobacteria bacterium]
MDNSITKPVTVSVTFAPASAAYALRAAASRLKGQTLDLNSKSPDSQREELVDSAYAVEILSSMLCAAATAAEEGA